MHLFVSAHKRQSCRQIQNKERKTLANDGGQDILIELNRQKREPLVNINDDGEKLFDLNQFYAQCESGGPVDKNAVIQYIQSFDKVIIWGSA